MDANHEPSRHLDGSSLFKPEAAERQPPVGTIPFAPEKLPGWRKRNA
jgi:hypothetical protein